MGKRTQSLRFGLNTFWLGFMHKNKQKHGEKAKNWGRSGNWQSSLLVQRAWKFWTKQPISKLLLHKGRICEHPGEIHCIKDRQASTTDFLFAINTAPAAVTLYSYPGVHCPFIYLYARVCARVDIQTDKYHGCKLSNSSTCRKPSWGFMLHLLSLLCFQRTPQSLYRTLAAVQEAEPPSPCNPL